MSALNNVTMQVSILADDDPSIASAIYCQTADKETADKIDNPGNRFTGDFDIGLLVPDNFTDTSNANVRRKRQNIAYPDNGFK